MRVPYEIGKLMVTASRALPLRPPDASNLEAFQRDVLKRARSLYDTFYGRYLQFEGKEIGELGAAPYAMAEYLREKPAHYYPINIAFTESIVRAFPNEILAGTVQCIISTTSTLPLPSNSLDAVVSENCFEHLENYEGIISEIHRVLRPNGFLLTQFSPLYFSPYGAHFHEATKLPYVHLIGSEDSVRRWVREELRHNGREHDFEYMWNQYATLNKLKPNDFIVPFQDRSRWQLMQCETFPFRKSNHYPPPLAKLLTHGFRIAAQKRDS